MNDGFHYLDIIFFAMVAAFLVLRLRSVLGRRTGEEPPPERFVPPAGTDSVIDLAAVRRASAEPAATTPIGRALAEVRAIDPVFDLAAFLGGARGAFQMIVEAYAAGEIRRVEGLLAADVLSDFAQVITARAAAGETLSSELISIRSADLVAARVDQSIAHLTVRFVSEQVNALRDAHGQLLDGTPDQVIDVVDDWTFSRDLRSPNPNWTLTATRPVEE